MLPHLTGKHHKAIQQSCMDQSTHTGTTKHKHNFSLIHVYPQTTLFKIDFPSWYLLIKFINFWQSSSKFFSRNNHKTAYSNSHRQPVLNSGECASRTMMKKSGPRSEFWCTTIFTLRQSLKQFSPWTLLLTSQCIAWKICIINISIPSFLITQQSTWWGTLSKAFCRSTNARYWFFFFFFCETFALQLSHNEYDICCTMSRHKPKNNFYWHSNLYLYNMFPYLHNILKNVEHLWLKHQLFLYTNWWYSYLHNHLVPSHLC